VSDIIKLILDLIHNVQFNSNFEKKCARKLEENLSQINVETCRSDFYRMCKENPYSLFPQIGLSIFYLEDLPNLAIRHADMAITLLDQVYLNQEKKISDPEINSDALRKLCQIIKESAEDNIESDIEAQASGIAGEKRQQILNLPTAERIEKALVAHGQFVTNWIGGNRQNAHWFRGRNSQKIPSKNQLKSFDDIDKFFLKGWVPDQPFISKKMQVTTLGSCFAEHIVKFLNENFYLVNKNIYGNKPQNLKIQEGMVNTYTLLQQFEWAFEEDDLRTDLWFDGNNDAITFTQDQQTAIKELFLNTNVFIITLGLSEVFYDKISGNVLMRFIAKKHHGNENLGFKISNVEENIQNLERILLLIRKFCPNAHVIFTLSPVRLQRTFRQIPAISANSVSKSILRVAIDELVRKHESDDKLYYFPSFELITDFIVDPYEDDNLHPKIGAIDFVMEQFSKSFLEP
jgi:hypothetical protein